MSSVVPLSVFTVAYDTKSILWMLVSSEHPGVVNINEAVGNSTLQFSVVDGTTVNGDLHICGIATDKGIYHTKTFISDTSSQSNGINWRTLGWQSSYGDVNSENQGSGYAFQDLSCAGDESNGDVHVCAVGTSGVLLHTIRHAQGNWQGSYGDVNSENTGDSDHPAAFTHVDCTITDGTLHVCTTDSNGGIWYTYRAPDGNWQGSFQRLQGQALDISCTSVGNDLHVCTVEAYTGLITHASLPDGGSWLSLDGAPSYDPSTSAARFYALACGTVAGSNDLHVCAINNDSHILHTACDNSGNWQQSYDDVNQNQQLSAIYPVVGVCM